MNVVEDGGKLPSFTHKRDDHCWLKVRRKTKEKIA